MKKIAKILAVVMLVAVVAMSFASCGLFGLDLDKVEDRLDKKDYDVESYSFDGVTYLFAENDDDEAFSATEYETTDDAKEALEDLKDNWDDMKEFAEEEDLKITYGRKGKVVYYGTVKGVKAALGFPSNLLVFAK